MMKDLQGDVKGITIGGKNYATLRYADDAVFVGDKKMNYKDYTAW